MNLFNDNYWELSNILMNLTQNEQNVFGHEKSENISYFCIALPLSSKSTKQL